MMVWKWYDWMIVVWWFVSCVCEGVQLKKLQTVVKEAHTLFLVFFKLRNKTQSTSLSFRFLQLFHLPTWLENILKTSEDQVIKPSVVIRFDVVYPRVSPEDPEEQKCSFLFFLLSIILKYKKVFRVFINSKKRHKLKSSRVWRPPLHNLQIFNTSLHGLQERRCLFTFFQPLINTNFTKIFFSRPNLKKEWAFEME